MNDEVTLGMRGGELPKLPHLGVWMAISRTRRHQGSAHCSWCVLLSVCAGNVSTSFVGYVSIMSCVACLNTIWIPIPVRVRSLARQRLPLFLGVRSVFAHPSRAAADAENFPTASSASGGLAGPEPWMTFRMRLMTRRSEGRHGTASTRAGGVFEKSILAAWLHLERALEADAKCSTNLRSGLPCMKETPFPMENGRVSHDRRPRAFHVPSLS